MPFPSFPKACASALLTLACQVPANAETPGTYCGFVGGGQMQEGSATSAAALVAIGDAMAMYWPGGLSWDSPVHNLDNAVRPPWTAVDYPTKGWVSSRSYSLAFLFSYGPIDLYGKRPLAHPCPTHWRLALTALTLALAACGGGTSPPPGTSDTLAQQIQALERSGQLPVLDRSSDIRGPDVDDNGIRDDIDAWIAALPINEAQKKAAQQSARVLQRKLLVRLDDQAALAELGVQTSAHIGCLHSAFAPDFEKASKLGAQIEALTANTRERAKRYLAYNRAVSGSVGTLLDGDNCEP